MKHDSRGVTAWIVMTALLAMTVSANSSSDDALILFDFASTPECAVSNDGSGFVSPVIYIKHGFADPSTWRFLTMVPVWWNESLASASIPRSHQFVFLCVGSYIHCSENVTIPPSIGRCNRTTGFSNFQPSAIVDVTLVFALPNQASENGELMAVMTPFCAVTSPVWNEPSNSFILSGSSATSVINSSSQFMLNGGAPCNGNGRCDVFFGGTSTPRATCTCRGAWSGGDCSYCNCSSSTDYCVALQGTCLSPPPQPSSETSSLPPASLHTSSSSSSSSSSIANNGNLVVDNSVGSQGIAIILLWTQWYDKFLDPQQTFLRFDSGNITNAPGPWRNWYFTTVDAANARWGTFNASSYTGTVPDTPGLAQWMMVMVPGNLLQYVIYSFQIGDYVHCNVADQLLFGIQKTNASFAGAFQCIADQLNGENNFASVGGVIEITPTSFSLKHVFQPGCQMSIPDPQQTSTPCSGRAVCSAETYFHCMCPGNFTGIACETCACGEGATCNDQGACICANHFMACGTQNKCVDVWNDTMNCGACGNDCTQGIGSAVESARCIEGVCHVKMVSPLNWLVCFGSDKGSESDSSHTTDSSGSSTSVTGDGSTSLPISCFRGYDFLIVFGVSFPLFIASLISFLRIRIRCRHSHQHRQALFVLIAIIGGLRASYAIVALIFLATAKTPDDAVRSRQFFAATMITLNAYADLLAGFIDVLLTVYWLFVLDRITEFPKRLLLMACFGMAMTLTVATVVDYATVDTVFDYTFFTLAILLFFTALMHMTVIIEVLYKFFVWWRADQHRADDEAPVVAPVSPQFSPSKRLLEEPSELATHRLLAATTNQQNVESSSSKPALETGNGGESPPRRWRTLVPATVPPEAPVPLSSPRHSASSSGAPSRKSIHAHFLRVTVIAFVCLLCWMVRSVMLLGRATRNPVFYTGSLSFANPVFTLLYFTVLTLFPCILIAAIFIALSFDVMKFATHSSHAGSFASSDPSVTGVSGGTNDSGSGDKAGTIAGDGSFASSSSHRRVQVVTSYGSGQ